MKGSYRFRDCYAKWDGGSLTLGNCAIEGVFCVARARLQSVSILNKQTGYCWEASTAVENTPLDAADIKAESCEAACPSLVATVNLECSGVSTRYQLRLFSGSPFISVSRMVKGPLPMADMQTGEIVPTGIELSDRADKAPAVEMDFDLIERIPLPDRHYKMTAIKLFDKTDNNDILAIETKQPIYKRGDYRAEGNLFILDDYLAQEALLLIKEAPAPSSALCRRTWDIRIRGNNILELRGTGLQPGAHYCDWVHAYGYTVGAGATDTLLSAYKRQYKNEYPGYSEGHTYIMSNTWGDRNQDAAIDQAFISREIELAKQMGVDIVQIDDGWQKGITQNSKLASGGGWEGYYAFDSDFWSVHPDKFPNGLEPLVDQARLAGVKLGLWFSPDSSNGFANWRRDAQTLLALYRRYSMEYFKLDGVKIRSKYDELNFIHLMEHVTVQSGGAVHFNLDITAEDRFGYLYHKQFGTLFVENRYTDWGNYYPHNTLKNLWTLCRYFPADKLQFELVNNARNTNVYGDDPLAPHLYPIGYLFAAVMPANPLLFMELSGLSEDAVLELQKVIAIYKQHRDAFVGAEVLPIGDMPDGVSFTGFQIICSPNSGYLLLFRENTRCREYCYALYGKGGIQRLECLYATADWKRIGGEHTMDLNVMFQEPRTAVFIKYTLNELR